ncbi:copper chaperone PCu(A)C [Herminiimonas fonticola]|uniref:copper chaperone PCu(A)C n=1 Tax=Herminiimonas fonticola TaxID=303380 RepID=UPI00333E5C70
MNLRSLFLATFALLLSSVALAHDYRAGDIRIDHPYARATVAGQTSGSAYFTMENTGKQSDTLIAVQSPAAKSAEIHTMSMTADHVMRMREVDSIELKAQEKVTMLPGDGYHIMLLGLTAPLKAGDKLPLVLTFRKAGKVNTTVTVETGKASTPETKRDEHHQHR